MNTKLNTLKDKKFFLLDKDGTLSLGNQILNGTKEFIQALRDSNKKFSVATNNSSKTGEAHLKNFNSMGLDFKRENMIVSLDIAIDYLQNSNVKKLFWLANKNVSSYLEQLFDYDENEPDCILITFDTELNYSKLVTLTNLLHTNVPYYVTHSDIVCPTDKHDIPDVGTFIKLMEMTTGKSPDIDFGKPSQYYIDYIKKTFDIEESDMVMIGDRLYTDIKLAEGNDITSVLVLSGETSIEDYKKSNINADIVTNSASDLVTYLK